MTDNNTTNTPTTEPRIVGHEFAGDKCKVEVHGHSAAQLTSPTMKKSVYEYRHAIGASHMGLNRFEPIGSKQAADGSLISAGYWYLMAGL
tara:strand:- start:25 stop:294 length:270 start_codon:yes stop_codon:yes gene_type:complete